MAKDLTSALGAAELNALMAVQLNKLEDVTKQLGELFTTNQCRDFNAAYKQEANEEFIGKRNELLDKLYDIVDIMSKLRAAQHALSKK